MGSSFPGLPAARAWGMQAIQAWPFLRSSLVQQAVGGTHSIRYSKEAT